MTAVPADALPLEPFVAFLRRQTPGVPDRTLLAEAVGCSNRHGSRLLRRGWVRTMQADKWACQAEIHPSYIWGDAFYAGTALDAA